MAAVRCKLPQRTTSIVGMLFVVSVSCLTGSSLCSADGDTKIASIDQLAIEQSRIAEKYSRLEQLMIRMAEVEAPTNPQRSALLKRAAQQSADRLTRSQLNTAATLLAPPAKLKRAIDGQEQVLKDLEALLELLLSEDRSDRIRGEEARIREYIKEVERLLRLQRAAQGRTEGGADQDRLAKDQGEIANRTERLAQRIQETEEGGESNSSNESNDGESKDGAKGSDQGGKDSTKKGTEDKDSEKKDTGQDGSEKPGSEKGDSQSDTEPKDGEKSDSDSKGSDGESKEGKPKPEESGESDSSESPDSESKEGGDSESKPSQASKSKSQGGKPQQGESGDNEQQSEQQAQEDEDGNPARKRIQAAEDRMRRAKQKLEEAKRKDAVEEQQEARRELEMAKAQLEEILRQLREEEVERMLAMLEGRFRRMLDGQLKIYEATMRLDKIPPDDRGREVDIQASKLSFDESKLVGEADKALLLLLEEGSSIAFPETVQQMRDEMQRVADRLATSRVGLFTQTAEEEIIASLEEMIEAMQKAQQDLEKQQQQQPQQATPSNPEDMPLVDKIAELKMIRALQMRVNTRTQRYAKRLEDVDDPVGSVLDEELREALQRLAERQERIHRITSDIILGKNK